MRVFFGLLGPTIPYIYWALFVTGIAVTLWHPRWALWFVWACLLLHGWLDFGYILLAH